MTTKNRIVAGGALGALLLAQGATVQAKTPSDVTDLIGVRASSGESILRDRGYEYTSGRTGSSTKWGYWWHKGGNRCISVATVDGRYQSIDKVSAQDCGKSGSSGSGAAVAIGAAAIIGALAIASSNKDKDRDRYPGWNGSQYPHGNNVTPYELRYIIGMNTNRADNELRNNRYKFETAGNGYYTRWSYWWNKRESSCIGVTSSGGRIESIVNAAASACGKSGYAGGGFHGTDSYSPSRGVTCYPAQRSCYESGAGYSAYWTSREFRY